MHDQTLKTEEAYDQWAATYDHVDNPMIRVVEEALPPLTVGIGPLYTVLELGCGTGRNLAYMREHGATCVVGVDLSAGMLAKARKRLGGEVLLFQQDIRTTLPVEDGSVDLVLVSLVLEHIDDTAPVFEQVVRVLRPGGRVVVFELHPEHYDRGKRAHFETESGRRYMPAHRHSACDLEEAAAAAGLEALGSRSWAASAGETLLLTIELRRP